MKIGIDATAVSGSIVGHSSYVANLIKQMLTLDFFKEHKCILYCRGNPSLTSSSEFDSVSFKACRFKNRKLCEQLWLSCIAPFDGLDLFHSTWSLPLVSPKRSILTLHGLAAYLYPELFTTAYKIYLKMTIKRNVTKATRYIAISQSTKEDFIEYMKIPESKIDVVHHGVDIKFFEKILDDKKINELKKNYSLPNNFILFVSALIPIKNIETLIKAYHNLIRDNKNLSDIGLVIAGSKGWQYEPIFNLVHKLKLQDKIVFTGYFPQRDLPTLYSAAKLFVLPSIYEGFGIPVVEAFACGTPVITSNISCLPEVAGDAAILVDPKEPEELANAMVKVLSNHSLQKEMIKKGMARAKEFTWRKTAEKTIESYNKALNG
jgi:glycosyltransferase involved in cell wall biosynthesis